MQYNQSVRPSDPPTPTPTPRATANEPLEVAAESAYPDAVPGPLEKAGAGSDWQPPYKYTGQRVDSKTVQADLARNSGGPGSSQGQEYTWQDGDRTLTALLQNDLTVSNSGEIRLREGTAGIGVRSDTPGKVYSLGLPVFRSQSGTLMTLPGGVLLALDETWGRAETDAFFKHHGIGTDRVSELDYLANGFFVETEPGWASLELANTLAGQDGVRISSPNWWRERVPK